MGYRMRNARDHVVNIYGFDFDPPRHVALMAMELGDDSLQQRIKKLHRRQSGYSKTGTIRDDYISSKDRKNIWVQLVEIIMILHRNNIVS